jgi:hypothetical protein
MAQLSPKPFAMSLISLGSRRPVGTATPLGQPFSFNALAVGLTLWPPEFDNSALSEVQRYTTIMQVIGIDVAPRKPSHVCEDGKPPRL